MLSRFFIQRPIFATVISLVIVIGVVTTVLQGYARVFMPFSLVLTLFLSILGLIAAAIQAYIFAVLALVYIGAAVEQKKVKATVDDEPHKEKQRDG